MAVSPKRTIRRTPGSTKCEPDRPSVQTCAPISSSRAARAMGVWADGDAPCTAQWRRRVSRSAAWPPRWGSSLGHVDPDGVRHSATWTPMGIVTRPRGPRRGSSLGHKAAVHGRCVHEAATHLPLDKRLIRLTAREQLRMRPTVLDDALGENSNLTAIRSTTVRSHPRQSKVIRGHQRPSERRGEHTWSASLTVDRRCATTSTVRPLEAASIASCTSLSDSASSAEVASSSRRIRGSERSARAMATRCFCPPLSLTPRSPTSVAYLMRGTIRGNQNALIMLSACSQHAKRCNQKQSDALRLREQHRTRRNQTQSDCASSIVPVGEPFDE